MKQIKIAIIAHSCRVGGGLVATLNLIREMFNTAQQERFLVICSKGYGYENLPLPAGSQRYVYEGSHAPLQRYYFENVTLPKIINTYQPDVIFGPGNIGIDNPPCPQATFIRNAYLYYGPERYPQATLKDRLRACALRRQIRKSLPSIQMIFAQTPVVQERFSKQWSYPAKQIKIIRFPVPAEIQPYPECPVPEPLEQLGDSFKFLMLTRYLAHRNPEILTPLCVRYGDVFRERKIRFITTIGQHQKGQGQVFLEKVKRHNLEELVVNVGGLSRQQVVQYYTHCDVLWLHTLMETLCLPFLEAMTMQVPILAPDFDFSRYVCGEAALYYDPWDLKSLFDQIITIKEHQGLRDALIENGCQEIKKPEKFSGDWCEAARELLDNLGELVN